MRDIVPPSGGFLVPPANPDALANKLVVLADHPECWPDMGRAGRGFVEARHDIVELDARLAALFQELLLGPIEV